VTTWSTLKYDKFRTLLKQCNVVTHCCCCCCSDYLEHFESEYVQDFIDTLAENDIPWALTPLYRPDVAELVSFI
jgi:hypothetical protein